MAVTEHQAAINRSLLILGTSLAGLFVPGRFMIGPTLMLAAIGFSEVIESLQDPGPTGPKEEP